MTVDRELVTRKMLLIARDLDELRGMLPSDVDAYLASRKDQAMGIRNPLVHEYNDLDQRKVFEALQSALRDIPGTCSVSTTT